MAWRARWSHEEEFFNLKQDAFLERVISPKEQLPVAKEFLDFGDAPPQAEHLRPNCLNRPSTYRLRRLNSRGIWGHFRI